MKIANYVFILCVFWLPGNIGFTLDDLIEDDSWNTADDSSANNATGVDLPLWSVDSKENEIDTESTNDTNRLQNIFSNLFEKSFSLTSRVSLTSEIVDIDDGPVDCLGLTPTLRKAFQFLFKPFQKEVVATKFYLSTRTDSGRSEWNGKHFHPTDLLDHRDLILIIHGFLSTSDMKWIHNLTRSILDKQDVNVVAVDWGGGSMSWRYWRAVGNTKIVGKETAAFLAQLMKNKMSPARIHCIGHSLGAHICSFAARHIGIFGRITGLDPAQPCFNGRGLSKDDALYVDVVHTNSGLFGRYEKIGTHDFYPNGGVMQPGCRLKDVRLLQNFPLTRKKLENAICSHGRSYEYYIDSIKNDACKFWGRIWDFSKESALKDLRKPCTLHTCSPLGLDSIRYHGDGALFVPTNEKTPFCIPDFEQKKISLWERISRHLDEWRIPLLGSRLSMNLSPEIVNNSTTCDPCDDD